jgi:AcrR family transcriptional regulator
MSERQEAPEARASNSEAGPEPSSGGAAGQKGTLASGATGPQAPSSGGAADQEGSGGDAPDVAEEARDMDQEIRHRGQELRDRGRELRELGRERARELRELARVQREVAREQARELRELARAERVAARGLRGPGRGRAGSASAAGGGPRAAGAGAGGAGRTGECDTGAGSDGAGSDGQVAGDEKSTRERVLDVALDVFIEQGYDKASLREIAERMGFTKAALYYHFPSKADMLLALHQRMHNLIDEPLSLLGEGTVNLDMWEKFLDACINTLRDNQKIFQMHRINQSALAGLHAEGHEGAHQELEEKAMRIFSEPSLSPEERLRMAAAFAVSFLTPFMTVGLFSDAGDDFMPNGLREIVHRVLQPEVAKRAEKTDAAATKREAEKPGSAAH